jgi:hypothetical protein
MWQNENYLIVVRGKHSYHPTLNGKPILLGVTEEETEIEYTRTSCRVAKLHSTSRVS